MQLNDKCSEKNIDLQVIFQLYCSYLIEHFKRSFYSRGFNLKKKLSVLTVVLLRYELY